MPRYFFHVKDGADLPDTVGTELAASREARQEAFVRARDVLKAYPDYWDGTPWTMRVVDQEGNIVLNIGFDASRHKETPDPQP